MASSDWTETKNEIHYAVLPSDHFRKDSIRYMPYQGSGRALIQEGIGFVGGRLLKKHVPAGYDPTSFVVFSVRFKKPMWTKKQAQQWIKDHCAQISWVRSDRTLPHQPRTCNQSLCDNMPADIYDYEVGDIIYVNGSSGINGQHAKVERRVNVDGELGYHVRFANGDEDQVHAELCEPKRESNPWGTLQDGREVYWMKEKQPTSAERLGQILGVPVRWIGFLSAADRKKMGLEKDGFVATIEGKDIGLGRSVEEAMQATNAPVLARDKAIFSGSLGALVQRRPDILQREIKTDSRTQNARKAIEGQMGIFAAQPKAVESHNKGKYTLRFAFINDDGKREEKTLKFTTMSELSRFLRRYQSIPVWGEYSGRITGYSPKDPEAENVFYLHDSGFSYSDLDYNYINNAVEGKDFSVTPKLYEMASRFTTRPHLQDIMVESITGPTSDPNVDLLLEAEHVLNPFFRNRGMVKKRNKVFKTEKDISDHMQDALLRTQNPNYQSLGYSSEKDMQRDIARLSRDLPDPYTPSKEAIATVVSEGASTVIYATTRDGAKDFSSRYLLVESTAVEASHIPHAGQGVFAVNPRYPEGIQERRYHKDLQEVAKVRNNAKHFRAPLVINTNPDAVNGPPIVDSNMIVLGGNSRTMTQQLLYAEGKGNEIKGYLLNSCANACFGINPSEVRAMKQPILVRQIDFNSVANPEEARYLVRIFNEVLTQDLDFASEISAIANKITRGQWREIAQFVASHKKDDDTLNSYLLSSGSYEFVQMLYRLGVLTERNLSKFVFQNKEDRNYGLLNRFGRRMVSELFLGFLLKSPELIEQMGDAALSTFETIAPYLIISACCDPEWDITEDTRIALQAMNTAMRLGDDIYRSLGQMDMFGGGGGGGYSDVQATERRRFLFHVCLAYRNSPAKMSTGFKRYATRASGTSESMMSLPGTVAARGVSESLQELVLAFGASPDSASPSGYRLPNDPLLRKQNPPQNVSFNLPAKGGSVSKIEGIYDTDTGIFSPDLASPYQNLRGQVLASSEDADRAWRAVNLLTAAQGIASPEKWERARRLIDATILSNTFSESTFLEIRTLLFERSAMEILPILPEETAPPSEERFLKFLRDVASKSKAHRQAGRKLTPSSLSKEFPSNVTVKNIQNTEYGKENWRVIVESAEIPGQPIVGPSAPTRMESLHGFFDLMSNLSSEGVASIAGFIALRSEAEKKIREREQEKPSTAKQIIPHKGLTEGRAIGTAHPQQPPQEAVASMTSAMLDALDQWEQSRKRKQNAYRWA